MVSRWGDRVPVVSRWGSSTFAIPAWLVQAAPPLPNSHIPTLLPGPGPAGGAGWGPTGLAQLIQPFLCLALAKAWILLGSIGTHPVPVAGLGEGWQEWAPASKCSRPRGGGSREVTPQASSCRDGFESCGVSPSWSRLSGKTPWRTSGGLGLQTEVT